MGGFTSGSFVVDGATPVVFTTISQQDTVLNKALFTSSTLSPGEHTLIVTSQSETPLWVDYLIVHPGDLTDTTSPSSGASNDSKHTSHNTPTAAIAGSVVGAVVLLAGLSALLYLYCRHRSWARPSFFHFPEKRNLPPITREYHAYDWDPYVVAF